MKRVYLIFFIITCASLFFLPKASPVQASFLNDWVNSIKKTFAPKQASLPQVFSLDSQITLADNGDVAKNGAIDAGDVVRFTYKITNTTDKEYVFGTLKTNIDKKQINFIHNIKGTTSLVDTGDTITITNVRTSSSSEPAIISFDARIMYVANQDVFLTTQAQFISENNEPIAASSKKEVKVNRIPLNKIPKMLELKKK